MREKMEKDRQMNRNRIAYKRLVERKKYRQL